MPVRRRRRVPHRSGAGRGLGVPRVARGRAGGAPRERDGPRDPDDAPARPRGDSVESDLTATSTAISRRLTASGQLTSAAGNLIRGASRDLVEDERDPRLASVDADLGAEPDEGAAIDRVIEAIGVVR